MSERRRRPVLMSEADAVRLVFLLDEMQQATGLSRDELYESLGTLLDRGLISFTEDGGIRLEPVAGMPSRTLHLGGDRRLQ